MSFVKQRTQQEQADVLAQYLPNGDLWNDKNVAETPLRKILLGLAAQWLDVRATANQLVEEYDIRKTTLLLEEWEKAVGIPDCCLITANQTLEQRRKNVLLKLAGVNATTARQFENVAAILGYSITVEPGSSSSAYSFPFTFPFVLGSDASDTPFVTIIRIKEPVTDGGFPFTFPFKLGSGASSILSCLFNKLKPAHTINFYLTNS